MGDVGLVVVVVVVVVIFRALAVYSVSVPLAFQTGAQKLTGRDGDRHRQTPLAPGAYRARFADGSDGSRATVDKSGRVNQLFIPFTAVDPSTNKPSIVDARKFTRVRVTREGSATPTKPGATVLTGKLR